MTRTGSVQAQLVVVGGLLAAAGVAWWSTVARMAGMDAAPGTDVGTVGWFTVTWAVMMAAMMLPSLAPAIVVSPELMRRVALESSSDEVGIAGLAVSQHGRGARSRSAVHRAVTRE
jgi:predicted metal-binding membrane protein